MQEMNKKDGNQKMDHKSKGRKKGIKMMEILHEHIMK